MVLRRTYKFYSSSPEKRSIVGKCSGSATAACGRLTANEVGLVAADVPAVW